MLSCKSIPSPTRLRWSAPENLQWLIAANKEGERRTRVVFTLDGAEYNLPLTDPVWEQRLLHLKAGTHPYQAARLADNAEVWLTISLGEPFATVEGGIEHCYKLVAGVVVPSEALNAEQSKVTGSNARGVERKTGKSRRRKTDVSIPAYTSSPDLTAYPDPFADDIPTLVRDMQAFVGNMQAAAVQNQVAAVTEGRTSVTASGIVAGMLPSFVPAQPQADAAPIPSESVLPRVSRPRRKQAAKQDSNPDHNPNDKVNDKANGKWDSKPDQLLWRQQFARTRQTAAGTPIPWSEDEDALL